MAIVLSYKEAPDVVAQIDQLVMDRRRDDPAVNFSRAQFVRQAVKNALEDLPSPPVKMRERQRSTAA